MPNQVTSHNERTLFRALRALMSENKMSFEDASDALDRLMNAGLLIREPADKEEPKRPQGATPELKPTGNDRSVGN